WLKQGDVTAMANLRREAEGRGVAPERLVFAKPLPEPEYLASHRLADLFLDTFVYSAGSTGICALYAGLPMLTRPGDTNAARMGASICAAAGLEELICPDTAAYEEKAAHLATHPDELALLRRRLTEERTRLPLFDVAGFAGRLEAACRAMWENHRSRSGPQHVQVGPQGILRIGANLWCNVKTI
ncbi:MAG: glycosyltransferase, partial [Delftia sp.]|nr:glycosyltransferase [Delftia sp.]